MNLSLSTNQSMTNACEVGGELDVYSAPNLREKLQGLPAGELPNLIVDLSGIAFIDSTGLGVLVGGQNRAAEAGGALRLVCARERVLKLFRITGLDEVFAIYPTLPEAVNAS